MSDFVLDSSVAQRFLLPDSTKETQLYADAVLDSLVALEALAPSLLVFEMQKIIRASVKKETLSIKDATYFISIFADLPISLMEPDSQEYQNKMLALSGKHDLSVFESSYLALALMSSLPLATTNPKMEKAAIKEGVDMFQRKAKVPKLRG